MFQRIWQDTAEGALVLCPHRMEKKRGNTVVPVPLFIKALIPSRDFILMTSSKPIYPLPPKDLISWYYHLGD